MTFEIIVLHHKEPKAVFYKCLSSINSQVCFDFSCLSIIFAQDCEYDIPKEEIAELFPNLKIKYCETNVCSCGGNRNEAIKVASADYITFMDCDDILATASTLRDVFTFIAVNQRPLIDTYFMEELKAGGNRLHRENATWMHGKWIYLPIIKKYDIKFLEQNANEDCFFNSILCAYLRPGARAVYDNVSMVWCYNEKSITRTADRAKFYKHYIATIELTIRELRRRKKSYDNKIIQCIINCYHDRKVMGWRKNSEFWQQALKFYRIHKAEFNNISDYVKGGELATLNEVYKGYEINKPYTWEEIIRAYER